MHTNLRKSIDAVIFHRILLMHLVLILIAGRAWSQEYTVTDLGTLGGTSSAAYGINATNQVVGTAAVAGNLKSDPFLYSAAKMTDLWKGGKYGGAATAINESSHLVMNLNTDATGDDVSILWDGASWIDLGIGGATAMNSSDMVVGGGYWVYANGELNTNPGYPITTISNTIYQAFAYAVNDAGTIAGICESTYYYPWPCNFGPGAANGMQLASYDEQTAAIRDDGTSCGMGLLPPNYPDSFAIWAPGGTQTVNFVYNDNGKIPSEFESSFCSSLDNNGTAVGGFLSSFNTSNSALSVYGGLIYDPVNGGRDLNNLIAKPVSKLYSVYVYPAVGLSASGAIAANCRFKGPIEGIRDHACLLSPNWGNIVKGSILALAQGDPECIQCKTELVPEADSLPPNEDGLSAEEKRRAVETLEKIQVNLLKLGEADRNRISKDKIILLSHDTQEALVAFGYRLP